MHLFAKVSLKSATFSIASSIISLTVQMLHQFVLALFVQWMIDPTKDAIPNIKVETEGSSDSVHKKNKAQSDEKSWRNGVPYIWSKNIHNKFSKATSSLCSKWVRFEMARHTPCCLLAYAPRQAHIAIIPKMRPMIRAAASPPSNAETWSKRQAKTNAKNTWHTPEAAIFEAFNSMCMPHSLENTVTSALK